MKKLKQELLDRWLLYQYTDDKLFEKFDRWEWVFYCGFDPSADSLHLWNFIGFMVAIHYMRRWNKYIALTGGATWMIWDPGWKDAERNFLTKEALDHNAKSISNQISSILDNLKNYTGDNFNYDFFNNIENYKDLNFLDFLREVGKFITVNTMINKESVKKRIEDPSKSISYTEFSYQLMQWYDYCELFKNKQVTLQIGWQDQWGNLVTGTELIRKKYNEEVYAMTWPLITDSTWKKFWKSEWNAMFLDKNKTSPYFIYQYFMNVSDEDLSRYMKMLTLIETEKIDEIVTKHLKSPEKREWQKLLALKVVEIVHWVEEAKFVQNISNFMFSEEINRVEVLKSLNEEQIKSYWDAMWAFEYKNENLFEVIVKSGLAKSNSEARQSVQSWAIYINENKVEDFDFDVSSNFINDKVLVLRKWKKNLRIIYK